LIEPNDWHLDHMDDSPMMRSQSLPAWAASEASDPAVDRPVQLQVHEEPEEQDTESSSDPAQRHSDQHQPDEVWREYHPLLTGR